MRGTHDSITTLSRAWSILSIVAEHAVNASDQADSGGRRHDPGNGSSLTSEESEIEAGILQDDDRQGGSRSIAGTANSVPTRGSRGRWFRSDLAVTIRAAIGRRAFGRDGCGNGVGGAWRRRLRRQWRLVVDAADPRDDWRFSGGVGQIPRWSLERRSGGGRSNTTIAGTTEAGHELATILGVDRLRAQRGGVRTGGSAATSVGSGDDDQATRGRRAFRRDGGCNGGGGALRRRLRRRWQRGATEAGHELASILGVGRLLAQRDGVRTGGSAATSVRSGDDDRATGGRRASRRDGGCNGGGGALRRRLQRRWQRH